MKKHIALFIVSLILFSASARAEEFESQVRKIYADLAALMSESQIDIPAMIEFTDKYNADDLQSYSDLLNVNSRKKKESVLSKKDILTMIPENYVRMTANHADLTIIKYTPTGPWSATVAYEMKYRADMKLKDSIDRIFVSAMHLYSECVDELQRSARGYPQITRSRCRGAVSYGSPRYKSWHD